MRVLCSTLDGSELEGEVIGGDTAIRSPVKWTWPRHSP